MIGEQARQPLARARRIAGEHDLALARAQLGDMLDHGFVDIGALRPLGREIARRVDLEIEHRRAFGLVERGREVDRAGRPTSASHSSRDR